MASLRHHTRLYFRLLGAQVRSQGAYRTSFLLDSLGTLLITAAEFAALALVLPRFGSLSGWTLGEVCLLYGLAELAFVLMDIMFGGFDAPNLSGHVRSGSFSTFLLRPAPLTLQVFASDFALRRVARVVLAAAIAGYGLTHAGLSLNPQTCLLLLSSVLGMIAFFGALFVVGGTLTFWTVDSVEAMNVLTYGGRTLISYPMDIYGRALRRTFTFIIPAAFLSYFPVLRVLGRPLPDGLPDWAALLPLPVGLLALSAALSFFRFGVRHYQGTGT
ncbi:ABC transporter permease [Deinococcus aquaticus]|uniref:ABC transporter permease n=1 Tax=Deinococcus aquaticus TaxID=328692 RepID=UPI003F473315